MKCLPLPPIGIRAKRSGHGAIFLVAMLTIGLGLPGQASPAVAAQQTPPTEDVAVAANPVVPPPTTLENTANNQQPAFYVHAELTRPTRDIREGDALGLTVVSEQDAYLYILYEQVDGKIFRSIPTSIRRTIALPPRLRFRCRPRKTCSAGKWARRSARKSSRSSPAAIRSSDCRARLEAGSSTLFHGQESKKPNSR